jgi:hypothetical protein
MSRRILTLASLLALTLLLPACGGGSDEEDAAHDRQAKPPACQLKPAQCS